jgi:hypothetical protein
MVSLLVHGASACEVRRERFTMDCSTAALISILAAQGTGRRSGSHQTCSRKIMRRLLRDIAGGKHTTQDTTTLEDFSILARLREEEEG